jgi:hypothetical protein
MANINRINVLIVTANASGAGTDGSVYLGVCGREFHTDTNSDDFERNSSRSYVFGEGTNVNNASTNDPRHPALFTEDIDKFPIYIRFNPKSGSDSWILDRVSVSFNDGLFPLYERNQKEPLVLGSRSGLICYLRKHTD